MRQLLFAWIYALLLTLAGTVAANADQLCPVTIQADGASVHIASSDGVAHSVALLAGLLPEIHCLPDGRTALLATCSGWVFRLDLSQPRVIGKIRVGQELHGTALSATRSGQPSLLAVANAVPHTVVILDDHLNLLRLLATSDQTGLHSSAVLAVKTAGPRDSFVLALADLPELWEISYNPTAPEIALGMVHDFQYREGSFIPGYLQPQRISLPSPASNFWLSTDGHEVYSVHTALQEQSSKVNAQLQKTHLDVRRQIAQYALSDAKAPTLAQHCKPPL